MIRRQTFAFFRIAPVMLASLSPAFLPSCSDDKDPDVVVPTGDASVVAEGGVDARADSTTSVRDAGLDATTVPDADADSSTNTTEISGSITPAAGGTLTLGTTTVTVPPGAVAAPTTITIKVINPSSVASLPSGLTGAGPMVALLPHGLTFSQPVTVTLGHTSTAKLSTLVVLSLDDEQDTTWETVRSPTFTATTASFTTTKFSVKLPSWTGATLLYNDPGPDWVGHIALGGGKLFYSLENYPGPNAMLGIRSMNLDGSSPAVVSSFALPDSTTNAMVTTSTTLFFAAGQSVYSFPFTGGTPTPMAVPCAAGSFDYFLSHGVPRMITDGTQLFCTTVRPNAFGDLKAFSFTGTSLATLPDLQAPRLVALDGTNIVYSSFAGITSTSKALAPAGTLLIDRTEFGTGASPNGIAFDASFIYVLTSSVAGKAVVWRKPRAGGAIQPVTVPIDVKDPGAKGLLLVDGNLYFATQRPGSQGGQGSELQRIDKTATSGTPLTLGGANQSNFATDGTYIYYGNGTELLRMPK